MNTRVPGWLVPGHFRGVGEHRVANVQVEDQDERLQDCLHLHATVSAQAERVLLIEPTATRGDVGPTSKQVARLKGGTLCQTRPGSLERSVSVNVERHGPSQMAI